MPLFYHARALRNSLLKSCIINTLGKCDVNAINHLTSVSDAKPQVDASSQVMAPFRIEDFTQDTTDELTNPIDDSFKTTESVVGNVVEEEILLQ